MFSRIARIGLSLLAAAWLCAPTRGQDATTPAAAPAAVAAGPKRLVTIMNFDYGTVQNYVQQIFGSNQDIGKGISDMLVDKLLKDGRYRLVERSALDKILAEQNFSNSDRADSNTAAKIGKVLGVDAIIIGSITQFGRDDQHTNVGEAATAWAGSALAVLEPAKQKRLSASQRG